MFSFTALLIATLGYLFLRPLYRYLQDPHRLRRFPSAHPFAALTDFWIFSCSLTRKRYLYVEAAHRKHGLIVRIAPNHLSFADPSAFKAINGHGSNILKDDFYAHVAGGNPSMAQTTNRADHAKKRRWMSHVFSLKEITAMEPRVQERVGVLLRSLNVKAAGGVVAASDEYGFGIAMTRDAQGRISFDVRPWLNMLSYDAITAMFWSNTYGCLERGSDEVPALRSSGEEARVHAMASFHGTTSYLIPFAQLSKDWDAFLKRLTRYARGGQHVDDFGSMVRYLVTHRLVSPPSQPDLFSSIEKRMSPDLSDPVPLSEVTAECTTMLDAGNDTTQTSLTNCLYLLSLYPEKQTKLRQVLEATLPADVQPIASYQLLQHIPYLRAVLDESFRLRPPVNFGLPRKTVAPTVIAGHEIDAGVTVSCPLRSLHHNCELFSEPLSFVPERWLPNTNFLPEERQNLKDYVLPFSLGGRACIGRNLAYMELSVVIAALVLSFEWELDESRHADGLEIIERLNSNPKELWVRAKATHGIV